MPGVIIIPLFDRNYIIDMYNIHRTNEEDIIVLSMLSSDINDINDINDIRVIDLIGCHCNPKMTCFQYIHDNVNIFDKYERITYLDPSLKNDFLKKDIDSPLFFTGCKTKDINCERNNKSCSIPYGIGYCQADGACLGGNKVDFLKCISLIMEKYNSSEYTPGGIKNYLTYIFNMKLNGNIL